jgi:aspartate/methionine/tyrosine aminotransferase
MKIETFELERWMTRWELHVEYDIAESGILPMTAREVLNLLPYEEREPQLAELLDTPLGYSEAPGSLQLRTMLAETYHATGAQNILVTTGAIEANFLLFNVLLSPGDHVVAVYPAYQQLYSVPRAIPCDVSLWTLRPENGFRYDLEELRHLVTPRTKLVVLNTPHNPTGVALSVEELGEVYNIARSVGAQVLCDEAYRWIEMPDAPQLACPVRDLGEHGISVGTFSKPFGLPGLRVGWIAGPEDLIAACWAMRDYVSLSPAKLSDALATIALGCRDQITTRTQTIIRQNLATTRQWVAEHADIVTWQEPQGGLLSLLRYNLDLPSRELADRLAREYSVMLAPGSAFGYEGYVRLGLGQEPAIFAEGLRRTATCFADLHAAGVQMTSVS